MEDFSEKYSLDTGSTDPIQKVKKSQSCVLLIKRALGGSWGRNRETLYVGYISETDTWYVHMEGRTGDPVRRLPEEKLKEFVDGCETIETANRKFDDDFEETIPDELLDRMEEKRAQAGGQSGLNDFDEQR